MADDKDTKPAVKKAAKKLEPQKPVVPVKPVKLYTFEQWAVRRGIPVHHRPGRRAFVKNPHKSRTIEAWDACMVGY